MPSINDNTGGLSAVVSSTPAPATAGSLTVSSGYTLGVPAIPATALKVKVKNVGSLIEVGGVPGNNVDITVGGQTLGVGQQVEFDAVLDPVTNTYKYLSGLSITNAGAAGIWYEIHS